eukprot:CAMPEP_0184693822 /NCGR_PEP_ID=MMETSP0313-20130426/1969_1 /TAXON_ID=2792 /ORGANISM="Porphyridium aerugineum, Strain SAG 1380-2" /LENGTH=187 /DNA_ID=CAMNT_0027151995 /DNA_START=99 /DNA_END=662 /DNA_ORIENTATION=-
MAGGEEHASKKAKVDKPSHEHHMSLGDAVDLEYQGLNLHTLADSKVHVIKGLGSRADEIMEILNVSTVRELANWKFGRWAHSIVVLATLEKDDIKRPAESRLNIDLALDREHESKTLREIVKLPVSAFQGLTEKTDELLKSLHVETIEKLGKWKYLEWARAIASLVDAEESMTAEEKKLAKVKKNLE